MLKGTQVKPVWHELTLQPVDIAVWHWFPLKPAGQVQIGDPFERVHNAPFWQNPVHWVFAP